jgi:hypothetical protein
MSRKPWGAVAAVIAVCALVSVPFLVDRRVRRRLVAEEILSAHERALAGRSVDVISSDEDTVKPWFNGKMPSDRCFIWACLAGEGSAGLFQAQGV